MCPPNQAAEFNGMPQDKRASTWFIIIGLRKEITF